jgi:hypothetical protein
METHLLDEGDEMIAFLGEKLRSICLSEGEGMRKERGETKFLKPINHTTNELVTHIFTASLRLIDMVF